MGYLFQFAMLVITRGYSKPPFSYGFSHGFCWLNQKSAQLKSPAVGNLHGSTAPAPLFETSCFRTSDDLVLSPSRWRRSHNVVMTRWYIKILIRLIYKQFLCIIMYNYIYIYISVYVRISALIYTYPLTSTNQLIPFKQNLRSFQVGKNLPSLASDANSSGCPSYSCIALIKSMTVWT